MSPTGERNSVYNFEKKKNRIKLPESVLRQQDLKCRDKNITWSGVWTHADNTSIGS